jgi:glycosyltransferase involved in cell wall biosynthesis
MLGGIKEVIQNNENGILVAVENWEMLSNSIVELALNPTQLLNFQSEARKGVVENFSIKAMVTQLENLYKSCNPLSII